MNLVFGVPLDFPMFTSLDTLGLEYPVTLDTKEAVLQLPSAPTSPTGQGALTPATKAAEPLGEHVKWWGEVLMSGKAPIAVVEAVTFTVKIQAELGFDLGTNQVSGPEIDSLLNAIPEWLLGYTQWLWALTSQSLDINQPDPKFVSRKSVNMVYLLAGEGDSSLPASGSAPMTIVMGGDDQCSERAVNRRVLDVAIQRVADRPPLMLELLASSRMLCRRGDERRAIIDIGTAVEAALTNLLGLPINHRQTLGTLVNRARQAGMNFPADMEQSLVQARNRAAHRGMAPTHGTVCRALEIAEGLVGQVESALIPADSLRAVHRPQRQDLVIIKPPRPRSSIDDRDV
jgi:hypothetical protein